MIQRLINKYFFYLFVFTLFFGVLLYDLIGWRGMDIVADAVLLIAYCLFLFSTKERKINQGILVTVCVFLFYLVYTFFFASNNTRSAITLDFLMQIRPYLTFFIVSQMVFSFTDSQRRLLKQLCFTMWVFFIPLGFYGLLSPIAFTDAMNHSVVVSIVFLSLLYLYCCSFSLKERLMFLLMLSVGLIVLQLHFLGFFLLTCAVLMYFYQSDALRSRLRAGIAIALVIAAAVYISESQITSYLSPSSTVVSNDGVDARSMLYRTAGNILKDFFPLGSGFASFASHASKTSFSSIYDTYGLSSVNDNTNSYYPSLAQFGIVGIALYIVFWIYIVVAAFLKFRKRNEIRPFVVLLIMVCFVFIENVFDSFFTSNRGVFMMMFLGVLFSKPGNVTTARKKKEVKIIPLETSPVEILPLETMPLETMPLEEEYKSPEPVTARDADETEKVEITGNVQPDTLLPETPKNEVMDTDEEYDDDFEEYCEDENIENEVMDDEIGDEIVEDELAEDDVTEWEHVGDVHIEDNVTEWKHAEDEVADNGNIAVNETITEIITQQKETVMDKEFEEALLKIKAARAMEDKRCLVEEETDKIEDERDVEEYERLNYMI